MGQVYFVTAKQETVAKVCILRKSAHTYRVVYRMCMQHVGTQARALQASLAQRPGKRPRRRWNTQPHQQGQHPVSPTPAFPSMTAATDPLSAAAAAQQLQMLVQQAASEWLGLTLSFCVCTQLQVPFGGADPLKEGLSLHAISRVPCKPTPQPHLSLAIPTPLAAPRP